VTTARLAIVNSYANLGVQATKVIVEVHLSKGLPCFNLVGLPETAVKESKERVRSAIINSRFKFPSNFRITVNLAPADLPKSGGRFDLPIAVGILIASGQIKTDSISNMAFIGELALTGELRAVKGLLPVIVQCEQDQKQLFLPQSNSSELALVESAQLFVADHLVNICRHLQGVELLSQYQKQAEQATDNFAVDMSQVIGLKQGRKAIEIAAAGRHNLLMTGPPGTGKSMLAERLVTILPPLTQKQQVAVASLYSVAGIHRNNSVLPPIRHPHHSASTISIVGGGSQPVPGEISLAHEGVLFLDELPEFHPKVMESMREPLETKSINIARAANRITYPANFQLIAARNPCPCGYLGDEQRECQCSPQLIARYQSRISGPMLDRIELQVAIQRPHHQLLKNQQAGESSQTIKKRVVQSRNMQLRRQGKPNAELSTDECKQFIRLSTEQTNLLSECMEKMHLSLRTITRIQKVARTIADLSQSEHISKTHLLEAISLRVTQ